MRKWSTIAGVLLLSCAWVVAQSGSAPPAHDNPQYSQQPSSSQQQPDAAQTKEPTGNHGGQTLEGCITSVAGGYTLTDNSGKSYQLAGDTSKLANEVGHYDQVTGTEETPAAGAAASAGAPSTFTVRKVKVISTTCPSK